MSWLGKGAVGLVLMAGGVAVFGFSLYQLMKTGTCASGGPYVSARPCPEGTGLYIGALTGGIVAFLAGAALFATRGRRATDPGLPPKGDSPTANPPPLSGMYGPN
jgi:hypothetical protein